MGAIGNVEKLKVKKKKPAKPQEPIPHISLDDPTQPEPRVVRIPRVISTELQKRVDKLSAGEALMDKGKLGVAVETTARRQEVTAWMLNGHTYDNEVCDVAQLAVKLGVTRKVIIIDINTIKDKMAEFYTKDDDTRDVAALAHMLLEMKFRDRGQALLLYNMVLNDIKAADTAAEERLRLIRSKPDDKKKAYAKPLKPSEIGSLTGRDRAAMYSTALAAIDLANRTTNGMESLLKMTGGAQKLQHIIKIKNLQINKGSGIQTDTVSLQQAIVNLIGGVLPSGRPAGDHVLPPALALDADDKAVLDIAEREAKKNKVINAQPHTKAEE